MSSIKKIRTTEGDLSIDYNSLDNLPTIPSKVSELENNSGFITKSVSNLDNYYTKSEVDEKEITLNGSSVSSPSFYAPTTSGTEYPSAKCVYDWMSGIKIVALTQTQYDALVTKDSNTLYFITGA